MLMSQGYIQGMNDLIESFPDMTFTREGKMKYDSSPTRVTWTAVVTGTHMGASYSPVTGAKPVSARDPPKRVQNDAEKVTIDFAPGTEPKLTMIKRLKVEPLPGGVGFSGPIGFYLQAGGLASDLPK